MEQENQQSAEIEGSGDSEPEIVPPGIPSLNEAPPPEDEAYAEQFARELTPLLDHWQARAAEIERSFVVPPTPSQNQPNVLQHFAQLCLRFANLEQRIEGHIPCEIPAHFGLLHSESEAVSPQQGEPLAKAERERLNLPEGPIENLSELFDEHGLKIIEWDNGSDERSSAFLFDQDTGPALLALAPIGSHAARFLLAHAYCHLLADVDPYENRFCHHGSVLDSDLLRYGGRSTDSPMPTDRSEEWERLEARADRFARALLLPADHFRKSLVMFLEEDAQETHARRLGEVAFYYGVDAAVVLRRLADLELASADRIAALAAEIETLRESLPPASHAPATDELAGLAQLPARFVNLSLALFVKRIATREQLGRLLDMDRGTVDRLVGWLNLPATFHERQT